MDGRGPCSPRAATPSPSTWPASQRASPSSCCGSAGASARREETTGGRLVRGQLRPAPSALLRDTGFGQKAADSRQVVVLALMRGAGDRDLGLRHPELSAARRTKGSACSGLTQLRSVVCVWGSPAEDSTRPGGVDRPRRGPGSGPPRTSPRQTVASTGGELAGRHPRPHFDGAKLVLVRSPAIIPGRGSTPPGTDRVTAVARGASDRDTRPSIRAAPVGACSSGDPRRPRRSADRGSGRAVASEPRRDPDQRSRRELSDGHRGCAQAGADGRRATRADDRNARDPVPRDAVGHPVGQSAHPDDGSEAGSPLLDPAGTRRTRRSAPRRDTHKFRHTRAPRSRGDPRVQRARRATRR